MWNLLKSFFKKSRISQFSQGLKLEDTLATAERKMQEGDRQGAIDILEVCLKKEPSNVRLLNNLGICYLDIGERDRGLQILDLAYSLDDDFPAVVINRAKILIDEKNTTDALPLIHHAITGHPGFHHVNAVYGSLAFIRGNASVAKDYHLLSWLGNFDSLRYANCYLFELSYDPPSEAIIASEHQFWAHTLASASELAPGGESKNHIIFYDSPDYKSKNRVRIGYWSPDIYDHSIRYFLRPLLANHDHDTFEIILLHDHHKSDVHTDAMKASVDNYHNVSTFSDQQLCEFLKSLHLDILVELSGHSSFNRLNLLSERIATLQLSALGYPPTSGLSSIDAKIIDRHIATKNDSYHYSEYPAALQSSFWCFDPFEEPIIEPTPPVERNGFITFACPGNISKITSVILEAWSQILKSVNGSILILRSISFSDIAAKNDMTIRLVDSEIDPKRVRLLEPLDSSSFFSSYNEADIVLDTFPFNGGTTSCFATYMGVPIVTLCGDSLISRMGFSILKNLKLDHLCATHIDDYIKIATQLSTNVEFLRTFRKDARALYKSSALGNGEIYAREFESVCTQLLELKKSGKFAYESLVPALPVNEIVKRAYQVLSYNNPDAAKRIINYASRKYPKSALVHIFNAQLCAENGNLVEAISVIRNELQNFDPQDQASALLVLIRLLLLLEKNDDALLAFSELKIECIDNAIDRVHYYLYKSRLNNVDTPAPMLAKAHEEVATIKFILISSDESATKSYFDNLLDRCELPQGWKLEGMSCEPARRHEIFGKISNCTLDMIIIGHPHVDIFRPDFFQLAFSALENNDVIGFYGCDRWLVSDWRLDDFQRRAGCYCSPAAELDHKLELHWAGDNTNVVVNDMAVLDGGLIILKPGVLGLCPEEKALQIDSPIYEEFLTYLAYKSGLKLSVRRDLCVMIRSRPDLNQESLPAALRHVAKEINLDPFRHKPGNNFCPSVPISKTSDALNIIGTISSSSASREIF